ncbi:Oidioi.mRNA.OKI2018_I69.PAR.g11980.t1.cds [Oikopleura dioica]|uniref:Oidioi.mRNA.OKI2018_I69.PAR.g11980.t1.cds n=1 Tax=Oikopleura dioica TaxID=34765 RepID=A0ABN7RY72_OIKDI|nr:Oidioi.mRNA.OKI2018_I69.PAR.g11980.t1.cds [Oikopleura dioica]
MSEQQTVLDVPEVSGYSGGDLNELQKEFRAPKGADIEVRKKMLRRFFREIQNHRLYRSYSTEDGYREEYLDVSYIGVDISQLEPKEIAYLIYNILPYWRRQCWLYHGYDMRLYKFPLKPILRLCFKPVWNERMPISEEDRMIMEVTNWTQEQLYDALKIVQRKQRWKCCLDIAITIYVSSVMSFFIIGFILTTVFNTGQDNTCNPPHCKPPHKP